MRMRHLLFGLVMLAVVTSIGCGRRFSAYRQPQACCAPSVAMLPPTVVPACPPPCCP